MKKLRSFAIEDHYWEEFKKVAAIHGRFKMSEIIRKLIIFYTRHPEKFH